MDLAFLIFSALALTFGFVVAFGAPYLPTFKPQSEAALDLLELQPGQTLLELGCGDGRVMRTAAQRGLKVIGYELNPILVLTSRLMTWRYRRQVRVVWGNFWRTDWPPSEAIFVFLLDKYMKKLDKKVIQAAKAQGRPIKLLSFTFKVPDRPIRRQKGGLYLYEYK